MQEKDVSSFCDKQCENCANPLYRTPVFLSYATPYEEQQWAFIKRIVAELINQLLFPRTLGMSENSAEAPLTAIRRMILSSFGMLCVGFRRVYINDAVSRPGLKEQEKIYKDEWLTSPYLQIEPSMAFQQGLPLLILTQKGVVLDEVFGGILEKKATPLFTIEFDLDKDIDLFFQDIYWQSSFLNWVNAVKSYYNTITTKVMY